jgi:DNA-binding NtrC family response regulator
LYPPPEGFLLLSPMGRGKGEGKLITNSARRCKDNMETAGKTKKKVLIIDDDYYMCKSISQLLENEDMLVDYENNISSGVEKLLVERYEVIMLDIHLPGIDGISMLPVLKEITPTSKIILVSADDMVSISNQYSNVVVENFIQKPINREKLLDIINNGK